MNADWSREFNPAELTQKTPPPEGKRGLKKGSDETYFFATKTYFESCALWFEAALRWMTLLLTARSRAEL
jgi:hypothetical protein